MKIGCRLGLHNWMMWSENYEEKWSRWDLGGVKLHSWVRIFQDRRCQDCRETQKREVKPRI